MKHLCLVALLALASTTPGYSQKDEDPAKAKRVTIKMVEGLRFAPVRFAAKANQPLELSLENHDPNDQPHNFILCKPGSLAEIQAASMEIGPQSVENGFVPVHDGILVKSQLLNPEARQTLKLTVPDKPGIYPYICTFPGHAMVMYGALYVDTKIKGGLAYDPNIPQVVRSAELEKLKVQMDVERPALARMFMPNAGPAAIAVALPKAMNFCWDAGNCRLRYAWSGSFVDATRMWNSNGNALAVILGDRFWSSLPGEAVHGVQFGPHAAKSVSFLGYDLADGIPTFEYEIDGTLIRERISNAAKGLNWNFKIKDPPGSVRILVPLSDTASVGSAVGERDGDFWVVPQSDAADFNLSLSPK